MSIAHDVIQYHGGQLQVESAIDMGTTFTIRLPVSGKTEAKWPIPIDREETAKIQ